MRKTSKKVSSGSFNHTNFLLIFASWPNFFFQVLIHAYPQTASSLLFVFAKLLLVFFRLVLIPYCNMKSWFAIALAEKRTRQILREQADCKQSSLSLSSVATDNWKQFQCLYEALNLNNNGPLFLEFFQLCKTIAYGARHSPLIFSRQSQF